MARTSDTADYMVTQCQACGGQKIKVFNCDPEKNTQCDKEFCMHNINAIDRLCNHTTNPDFALEIGQKAQKKAYTPGQKN